MYLWAENDYIQQVSSFSTVAMKLTLLRTFGEGEMCHFEGLSVIQGRYCFEVFQISRISPEN